MGPWRGDVADVIEPLNRDYPRVIGRGDTGDVSFLPPFLPAPLLLSYPLFIYFSISLGIFL